MEIRKLSDIFIYQDTQYPQKAAMTVKRGLGWWAYSTEECLANINRLCAGLLSIGLAKGDKLVLLSPHGSPSWTFIDLACLQLGVVVVAIDPEFSTEQLTRIFKEVEPNACIVEDQSTLKKIATIRKPRHLYAFSRIADLPHWSELSIEPMPRHLAMIEGIKSAIHEDDLATIVYSDDAPETPGVMLSHKNILTTVQAIRERVALMCDKDMLSITPPHQLFERLLTYAYIVAGGRIYFKDKKASLLQNLKKIRPHFLGANSHFLEATYQALTATYQKKGKLRRWIFSRAVLLGSRYRGRAKIGPLYWLQLKLADWLIFRSWRQMLGNRIEGIILQTDHFGSRLSRIFSAAGIEILESYSQAEVSGILSIGSIDVARNSSIITGRPLSGMMVRIQKVGDRDIGEIQVKGNGVMIGYYNQPSITARSITKEGWLKTGRKGKLIDDTFLHLAAEKKNKASEIKVDQEE